MNYWQGDADTPPGHGKFARYAWGDDYHDLIERRLADLAVWLAEFGGSQKPYVDTGPVLERDFAALAGAGWHGKSTMLISRELGTWFFLAEILTTLDLPPDEAARDRCGACTRCITACPTGAIDAPHHLDARRCISYLTIELKGSIPVELRPLIGDRVYGCDDCLMPVEPLCPRLARDCLRRPGRHPPFLDAAPCTDRRRFPPSLPRIPHQAHQAPGTAPQRLRRPR
jgi:epoxyqueuosine reductase